MQAILLVANVQTQNAVQQKTTELSERKKTDPTCNYMVNKSPNGKEYIVDFVLGESKNDKIEIQEFNIYHYKQVNLGNNKKGLLVYAYTKRAYGDNTTAFLKNLKSDRVSLLNTMIASEMPAVKIADK